MCTQVYVGVFTCIWAYMHTRACKDTKLIECVFLDCAPPFLLRQSLSPELRVHWLDSFPQGSPLFAIRVPGLRADHHTCPLSMWVLGIWTPVHMLMQRTLYPSSPLPRPSPSFQQMTFYYKNECISLNWEIKLYISIALFIMKINFLDLYNRTRMYLKKSSLRKVLISCFNHFLRCY